MRARVKTAAKSATNTYQVFNFKWTVNGELRIGFFACKPIRKDDELTFDYQFQTFGEKQQKCYCGTDKCRGVLSSTTSNNTNFDQLWDDSDETDSVDNEMDNDNDEDLAPINDEDDNSSLKPKIRSKNVKRKKYKKHDDLDVRVFFLRFLLDLLDCK